MEFRDLKKQYEICKEKIDTNINDVILSSHFIGGEKVNELEKVLADYVGTKYCITCGNGTDALKLALMAWEIKKGDAVFVPTFTFFSTAEVVSDLGGTPIFVDSKEETYNIDPIKLEEAIKNVLNEGKLKPRVIIPVDLFGLPAEYEEIRNIANKYNLLILEDGAQGFGGNINGAKACSFGDISTTSFFPAKPLGCYGDGGAIFTNDDKAAELIKSLKVHGKGAMKYDNVRIGMNSRLDTIQAGVLLGKWDQFTNHELDDINLVAKKYSSQLENYVKCPHVEKGFFSSWAQYTIILKDEKQRDGLQNHLKEKGIPSMVYYPKCMHQQAVYKGYKEYCDLSTSECLAKTVLSLPMHPYLSDEEIQTICSLVKEYVK